MRVAGCELLSEDLEFFLKWEEPRRVRFICSRIWRDDAVNSWWMKMGEDGGDDVVIWHH